MPQFDHLDAIDLQILARLQNNARISNKELSAFVGLSPSSCLRRVRSLEVQGALRGYNASVAPAAMGVGLQAMVSVQLRDHSRQMFNEFRVHLKSLPEVLASYSLGGDDDFLIHVAVRDAQHLYDVTMDHLATRPEVGHMKTAVIFAHDDSPGLPLLRDSQKPG
ncbi:MAG: AsnC family transcriptional regulator [Rhodobacterales bacterium]|nr:AsnC family transcriptional regulator [Rhodobacterales bacterium]